MNYVAIGYIVLMVSVRALVFLFSHGKTEKRWSAFNIGLRCANLLSARNSVWTLVALVAKRQGGVRHSAK